MPGEGRNLLGTRGVFSRSRLRTRRPCKPLEGRASLRNTGKPYPEGLIHLGRTCLMNVPRADTIFHGKTDSEGGSNEMGGTWISSDTSVAFRWSSCSTYQHTQDPRPAKQEG